MEQSRRNVIASVVTLNPERSEGEGSRQERFFAGACPERYQILRYAQNDRKRRGSE